MSRGRAVSHGTSRGMASDPVTTKPAMADTGHSLWNTAYIRLWSGASRCEQAFTGHLDSLEGWSYQAEHVWATTLSARLTQLRSQAAHNVLFSCKVYCHLSKCAIWQWQILLFYGANPVGKCCLRSFAVIIKNIIFFLKTILSIETTRLSRIK